MDTFKFNDWKVVAVVDEKETETYALKNYVLEETNAQYPQRMVATNFAKGDKKEYVVNSKVKIGDLVSGEVKLSYYHDEANGRYYPKVNIWRIQISQAANVGSEFEGKDDDLPW